MNWGRNFDHFKILTFFYFELVHFYSLILEMIIFYFTFKAKIFFNQITNFIHFYILLCMKI